MSSAREMMFAIDNRTHPAGSAHSLDYTTGTHWKGAFNLNSLYTLRYTL